MRSPKVVIVDTGCANLASLRLALERLGHQPVISGDRQMIQAADKVLLPGVGSAQVAMNNLRQLDLIDCLCQLTQPVLGICLGMQLMARASTESLHSDAQVPCLGIVEAKVTRLDSKGLPLPHMGWDQISSVGDNPLFSGIDQGAYFYFVHSYGITETLGQDGRTTSSSIAVCHYGQTFCAALAKENFYGVQFHPERSSQAGAQLLANFLRL